MLAVVLALAAAFGQTPSSTPLHIRAALVDARLDLKPVPRLRLLFTPAAGGAPLVVTTGFDGRAEAALPPGRYRLTTPHPVVFDGKQFSWQMAVVMPAAAELDLSNDNASAAAAAPAPVLDPAAALFASRSPSVVTVWSAYGQGSGFLVDARGLILTNQHVIAGSQYLAVQSDPAHKIPARLLASDPDRDVAVLWADPRGLPDAAPAPLAPGPGPGVVVGEEVFTIGSPLGVQKVLTTGIVSKIERHTLYSSLDINHGNSGGPLFNSAGAVVGLTTFLNAREPSGPGLSGIVTLDQAAEVLRQAAALAAQPGAAPPPPTPLPTLPQDNYPLAALRAAAQQPTLDLRPYHFRLHNFAVDITTPPLIYWAENHAQLSAERTRARRGRRRASPPPPPAVDLKAWRASLGDYEPVVEIEVTPRLRLTFLSGMARGLAAAGERRLPPARLHFAADFSRLRLFCGAREVAPILPGKIAAAFDTAAADFTLTDATDRGLYTFAADAIAPACGQVRLEVFSDESGDKPEIKILAPATVDRVWRDFAPYRAAAGRP